MIKEEQNPVGPVLTAAESRRRVLHNMCSSLLYNLSVILFGLLLPRLYLTSFGSELNGLDSTIKQIFSCLTLLEAGVGLASQQAYYLPVAVGDRKAINGIFSATHHYYRRTGIVYLLVTVVFALLYPLCINTVLSYGTVSLIVVFYGIPGIVSYLVQGKYRSFMEVEGKNYVITYITTATMAAGNLLRMLALLFTRSILLVQVTYCVPSVFQVLVLTAYMRKNYPWLNAHDTPNLEALAQRGSVLVHQLTSIVFNNTDTILISSLCGLASASVYTIYMLFFSNIEKLFYSIVNSISFRLGQLFYVEPEKFKRLYRLYDALYLSAAFALFTTVAVFLMPIIALYTSGVTDAEYLDTRLLVLFTAAEDSRVTVIHKPNGGLSDARNYGLCHAQGEYILFMDGDDWLAENVCPGLLQMALQTRADVVIGKAHFLREEPVMTRWEEAVEKNFTFHTIYTGKEYLLKCLQTGGLRVEVGRHLYRTDFLRTNGLQFCKGILHEDEEFTPRVLLQAQRVVLTGQEIYYYDNCRAGSITHAEGLSTRRVQDRLRIYDSLAEIYRTVTPRALRRRLQDDLCWKYLDCAARFDCRTLPGYRPQRLRMLQFACTPRRRAKAALFALSPELFRRVMNH